MYYVPGLGLRVLFTLLDGFASFDFKFDFIWALRCSSLPACVSKGSALQKAFEGGGGD